MPNAYTTVHIEPADASSGFRCGKHSLDDYFARHAVSNDQAGIGRARTCFAGRMPVMLSFLACLGFTL